MTYPYNNYPCNAISVGATAIGTFGADDEMEQGANETFSKYDYKTACAKAQGMIDTKQTNEIKATYVDLDFCKRLNIYRLYYNNRIRWTPLTLNSCTISCVVFTSENRQKIMQFEVNIVQGKSFTFFCSMEKIKWNKVIEKFEECGVIFNLDIKPEKQAEALQSYILRLVSQKNVIFIPHYRGWYRAEGKIYFLEEEWTWNYMKKICVF